VHLTQGRARQAIERSRAALAAVTTHPGQHVSGSTVAAAYLAEALYAADELPEAKRLLESYLPMISDVGTSTQIITSYRCLARIALDQGDPARASALLHALESIGARLPLPGIYRGVWVERSRNALFAGDVESAVAALRHAEEAAARDAGLRPIAEDVDSLQIGTLRLQVHTGRAADALPALREAIRDAEGRKRLRRAHQLRILLALALQFSGDVAQALRAMRSALAFAEAGGLMRSFADEGPAALRLLAELRLTTEPHPHAAVAPQAELARPVSEALTGKEIKIVRLVAEGQANKVIAQRLCISEATVKTHLRSISSKLGATNRTHAVRLARQLGLLGYG